MGSLRFFKSLASLHLQMADKDPEEHQEEKKESTPVASTSKDYDGKYRLSRAVSCSKIENESAKPEESQRSTSKKRKDPPSPPKVSVKDTKAKFEDIQEKYKKKFHERNQKEVAKEKTKFKRGCKKTPVETIEDPLMKMMKKMMADLSEIKTDVKSNNNKIDGLTNQVKEIENKQKLNEEKNKDQIEEIRKEIAEFETNVTTKLMSEINPSLEKMKTEIQAASNLDIRRIVQEEVEMMRLREAKENEKDAKTSGEKVTKGLEPEKTKNPKKNLKSKNQKKK